MGALDDIRDILNEKKGGYQWPGELAQPNHVLWRFAKWLIENPGKIKTSNASAFIEKIPEPNNIGKSGKALFKANVNILKGLALPQEKDSCFDSAAAEYGNVLASFDCSGKRWGNEIVKNTIDDLCNSRQAPDFLGKTFIVTDGFLGRPIAIPLFVRTLPKIGEHPTCLFDPTSIGIVNFHLENEAKSFLHLSVKPAWQWYLSKYGNKAKSLQWGFGHPASAGTETQKRMPSTDIVHLEGPSAGGAFAMVFRSAHDSIPMDQKTAISVQISQENNFQPCPVDGLEGKCQINGIKTILTAK